MATVPGDLDRSVMPAGAFAANPELAASVQRNPVFAALMSQAQQERDQQAMRWPYIYPLSGDVVGQVTAPFIVTIEQGTDFKCVCMTGRMYSYSGSQASSFPIPNALAVAWWAGDGLSCQITDTGAGRELVGGFVNMSLICTPGYGLNFQNVFPLRYYFRRNSKIRFDVRNRDNANRTHHFDVALIGYKVLTPA